MKIVQLLDGLTIPLSNEERDFVQKHQNTRLTSLNERDSWIARNLVRKGIYSVAEDNNTLIKQCQ